MGSATPAGSAAWRLELFAGRAGGVTSATIVSPDGRHLAGTTSHEPGVAERVASIAAGVIDLARAAAHCVDGGHVRQAVIELAGNGQLVVVPLDRGAHLVVQTAAPDREQLAFEICRLVELLNQPE